MPFITPNRSLDVNSADASKGQEATSSDFLDTQKSVHGTTSLTDKPISTETFDQFIVRILKDCPVEGSFDTPLAALYEMTKMIATGLDERISSIGGEFDKAIRDCLEWVKAREPLEEDDWEGFEVAAVVHLNILLEHNFGYAH